MPTPISIQLYTVRDLVKQNFRKVLEEIAAIGYAGVEPAGLHDLSAAEFKKVVDDLGMKISSAHTKLPVDEFTNQVLDEQEAIGNKLVISGCGANDFESEEKIKRVAERFSEAARNARARGIRVGYHNHWWEFDRDFNGKSGEQIFFENVDASVFAELDIYWVQTGGHEPAKVIQHLGDRCPLLHVKDGPCVKGEPMTAVGTGKVDIKAALTASDAVKWHVVELDQCATDMMEAVRKSYEFLTSNGFSSGRK